MKLSAALCKRAVLVEIYLKIIRFLLRGSPAQQKQMGWIMGGLLLTVSFEKPEIVIACMFEHAGFGADSAAPVVKK